MSTLFYSNINNLNNIPNSSDEFLENLQKFNNVFFVFPTGRYLRHFKNLYIKKYFEEYKRPVSKVPASNFEKFVVEIYQANINDQKNPLDDYSNHTLIELAFRNTDFKYFNIKSDLTQNNINKLASVIKGFEDEKIDPEELKKDRNGVENADKYFDILELYSNYLSIKAKNYIGITDAEVELSDLNKIEISKVKIYYFEFFNEFRRPDLLFIEKLFDEGVPLLINLDYTENVGPQYDNLTNSVHQLIEKGFKVKNIKDKNSKLSIIKRNLFNNSSKERTEIEINISKADNIDSEILNVIKLIKELNIIEKIPLKEIYIYSRNTRKYSSKIRSYFLKYGVPLNVSDRYELNKSQVVSSIFQFLRIPVSDFNVNQIISFLENPLFDTGFTNDEVESFKIYCSKNRKIRAEKSIDNLIAIDPEKAIFYKISNFIYDIFIELENLDNIDSDKFAHFIKKYIKYFKIDKNILLDPTSDDKYKNFNIIRINERNTRSLTAFLNLIDSAVKVWQKLLPKELLNYNDLCTRLEFLTVITKYQIRELFDNGVTFTSIEQARGINKKVSIMIGANEGEFPLIYRTNKLIGKELPETEFKHYNNERNLFYQFLTNGSNYIENNTKRFFIFHSKNENDKDFNPSSYINEIKHLFNLNYIKNNYFDKILLEKYQKMENINTVNGIDNYNDLSDLSKKLLIHKSDITHSQSSLDEYNSNPFVYFNKRILDAKTKIRYSEDISSLEKGDIFHRICEKYYLLLLEHYNIKKYNLNLADSNQLNMNKKQKLIDDIIQNELDNYNFINDFTNLDLDIKLGLNYKSHVFYNWIHKENILRDYLPELYTFLVEKEFNINFNNVKISGKIDRIDLLFLDKIYFIVYDYKSSASFPSTNDIHQLNSFQLPIYIIAVQELLKKEFQIESEFGAAFYIDLTNFSDKLQNYFNLRIANSEVADLLKFNSKYKKVDTYILDEFLNEIKDKIANIKENIRMGKFDLNIDAKNNYEFDEMIRNYDVF
jgi:ATP-dependent helicase/DNAse subunit B